MTEVITAPLVRDIDLSIFGVEGTIALITLDNGAGPRKPNTLGPQGLARLGEAMAQLTARARSGDIQAIAITGKPLHFAAGADLHVAAAIETEADAKAMAVLGQQVYRTFSDAPVPTFAFIGGAALGGGLELAISCHYRTAMSGVRNLGLPEVFLGLIPGWGGTYHLPALVGIQSALQVVVTNPLRNNRQLTAAAALEIGLVDIVLDPADFLVQSLRWAAWVLSGQVQVTRPIPASTALWQQQVSTVREAVDARLHGAAPAAYQALDLLELAAQRDRELSLAAEQQALARAVCSDEFRASIYAFDLTTKRAKRPVGAPAEQSARPVRAVGIIGAGLMASQLALLCARRMRVPVAMVDLDAERAERGLSFVHAQVASLLQAGRIRPEEANRLRASVSATASMSDLADSDLIIEAVFEELAVKQQVFGDVEQVVRPDTILATNTSALSVTDMASQLRHPERVVGLHFFNPVDRMPLVEVVRAERTDDATYATAFSVARECGKSAIAVADRPGFIVNRLLVRLLGEVLGSLEEGTPVAVADRALRPLGLPMGPFQLLQLVGPAVAQHVLNTLRSTLGERYPTSAGLAQMVDEGASFVRYEGRPSADSPVDPAIARFFGSRSGQGQSEEELLVRVRTALAEETTAMLDEGVVPERADIDLAMILGAGWPFHLGGITPYLERTGALSAQS
ncbi:MAG: 3-hydroxyacyl-CoA dehydrogenase NAD-binding domain-containing protein [Beutenbergiaceae bacterium]